MRICMRREESCMPSRKLLRPVDVITSSLVRRLCCIVMNVISQQKNATVCGKTHTFGQRSAATFDWARENVGVQKENNPFVGTLIGS